MRSAFGSLPDEIFSPLAGPNRHIHARVLLDLFEYFFADTLVVDSPKQRDVVVRITHVLGQMGLAYVDDEGGRVSGALEHPHMIVKRLRDTGWLQVYKEHYVSYVEMPPEAVLLLRVIKQISEGIGKSYGGAVLSILGLIQQAKDDPDRRATALIEAERQSKEFIAHLRALVSGLRHIEAKMKKRPDAESILRNFFEVFVGDLLITDYRAIKTDNNPFQFRFEIIREAQSLFDEIDRAERLAGAFLNERQADSIEAARTRVGAIVHTICTIFERIDNLIDRIDDFRFQLEQRVKTTVDYLNYTTSTPIGRLRDVIQRLSKLADRNLSQLDDFPTCDIIADLLPRGPRHLYQPPQLRTRPDPSLRRRRTRDPADLRYQEALRAFARRMRLTPDRVVDYLEPQFNAAARRDRSVLQAEDLRLDTLDDFLVFERLRQLPQLFGGILARSYSVEPSERLFESEWLICRSFSIMRVGQDGNGEDRTNAA